MGVTACSFLTSLGGLSGGADAGPPASLAPAPPATPPPATPPDAGAGEGIDASLGAAIPDDAAPGSPPATASPPPDAADAAPAVLFYETFESGPLPGAWDLIDTNRGAVSLDPANYVSPHTSFGAFTQAITAGQATAARLKKSFPLAPAAAATRTLVLETFVYLKQYEATTGADAVLAELEIHDTAGDEYELRFDVAFDPQAHAMNVRLEEHSSLADGGSFLVPHAAPDPLKLGQWTRIRIELVPQSPAVARLYVDGALELATPLTVSVASPASAAVSLGVSSVAAPSGPWVTEYDDVIYDVTE